MNALTLTLTTNCFGIIITYKPDNIGCANITSNMRAPIHPGNDEFNAAAASIESLVLAHFCAGIDVSTPAYLEGIDTAYNAVCQNLDCAIDIDLDDTKVIIYQDWRANAIVDERLSYEVSKIDWEAALAECDDELWALSDLKDNKKATLVHRETTVDEINTVFENTVVKD
jgi:hypothetical protein